MAKQASSQSRKDRLWLAVTQRANVCRNKMHLRAQITSPLLLYNDILTCVIDVQLVHNAFIPSAEHHHQLLNGHSSVSVSRARDRARPAQNPLPARLQNRGPRRSHVHFSSETQTPRTALISVGIPTAFVCQKRCVLTGLARQYSVASQANQVSEKDSTSTRFYFYLFIFLAKCSPKYTKTLTQLY